LDDELEQENRKRAEDVIRLGIEAQEKGDAGVALEAYSKALEILPDFPVALLRRGSLRLMTGNPEMALKDFDTVIAGDPKDSRAYAYRGLCYQGMGLDEQAVEAFSTSIELKETPSTFQCRGWSYRRMGKQELATEDFQRAVALSEQKPG
jgi:tetratricopeptide (TPR) repeat protein